MGIYTACDVILIGILTYLFIHKLYELLLMIYDEDNNHLFKEENKSFLNAMAKYSLITTIIGMSLIIQFICLFVIATHYVHAEEINVEYLQHCISTIAIMIDLCCLYLSGKVAKKIFDVVCKYPHQKCCLLLCTKIIRVRFDKETKVQMHRVVSSSPLSVTIESTQDTQDTQTTQTSTNQ